LSRVEQERIAACLAKLADFQAAEGHTIGKGVLVTFLPWKK
jgi:hypothetical protein